jgi:SAM-dependent methyltransferase
MDLRKQNNLIKRDFLNKWVRFGSRVLDVGCGQGGDIHKWRHIGVDLFGIDPSSPAIQEAIRRSHGYGVFNVGTIKSAPFEQFDVICYNFSIQYQSLSDMHEITRRLAHGGLLIGITTDSTQLHKAQENGIIVNQTDNDHISVFIHDTPYYANGPVVEPILDKTKFIQSAQQEGFELLLWEPFSIYAKFVFRYTNKG